LLAVAQGGVEYDDAILFGFGCRAHELGSFTGFCALLAPGVVS
jgi:hypothetical protein